MSDATLVLLVLLAAVAVFVWNRLDVGLVALLTALALAATGVIDAGTALSGFGDPVVVFIAALFVVSEGIDSSGLTAWAGSAMTRRLGDSPRRLSVGLLLLVALLAAVITPNGAVAALVPLAVLLAARGGQHPGEVLMPLAFAGSAGALLALTGSPVNVIVLDAAGDAGADGFGFFSFAVVGVPLVALTVAASVWLGPRVLPRRTSSHLPQDLSGYARSVATSYDVRLGVTRLEVGPSSPLAGSRPGAPLDGAPDVLVLGAQAASSIPVPLERDLQVGDVVVVSGPREAVRAAADGCGLRVVSHSVGGLDGSRLLSRSAGVVEVVVPPRSDLVDRQVFCGMAYGPDLQVLGVRQVGQEIGARTVRLHEGDAVLLRGSWDAVEALQERRDVLVVSAPDQLRRQAAPLGPAALRAAGVLLAMVVLLATGLTSPAVAGALAAAAMVLLGVVAPRRAYRAVSWQTVILIGGLIPLSTAIRESGAADLVADALVELVGQGPPVLLLLAVFVLTAVLGQLISNTATVLVVAPVAVAAALETGVSVEPVLMTVAVAGAAALLTPIATPANTMVMGPGGYAFGDYWRLGLPLLLAWLGVTLLVVPLAWPL